LAFAGRIVAHSLPESNASTRVLEKNGSHYLFEGKSVGQGRDRARDAIYAVDLLTAAIAHLNFFSWLADHPSSLGAICAQLGLQTRPVDVMLTRVGQEKLRDVPQRGHHCVERCPL